MYKTRQQVEDDFALKLFMFCAFVGVIALFMMGCGGDESPPASPEVKIASVTTCQGALTPTRFSFSYSLIEYTDGTSLASGAIGDAAGGGDSSLSHGATALCTEPGSVCGALGPISVDYDTFGEQTGGRWELSLDHIPNIPMVIYADPVPPAYPWPDDFGDNWAFPPSACVKTAP